MGPGNVEPCGRRLDPTQPPLAYNVVPGDGDLGMPTEDVGGENLAADPFLPSVDNFGFWRVRGDLSKMARLQSTMRVTEVSPLSPLYALPLRQCQVFAAGRRAVPPR